MNELKTNLKKGLTYALCFWLVYKFLNGILAIGTQDSAEYNKKAQEEYTRQQQKTAELMSESEKQMKRMEALMTKQEENARRFADVLTQMERAQSK